MPSLAVDLCALTHRDAEVANHGNRSRKHAGLSQHAHFDGIYAHKVAIRCGARQHRALMLRTMQHTCGLNARSCSTHCIGTHDVGLVVPIHIRGLHIGKNDHPLGIAGTGTATVVRLERISFDQENATSEQGCVFEVKHPSKMCQGLGIFQENHNITGLTFEVQATSEVVDMVVLKEKFNERLCGRTSQDDGVTTMVPVVPALYGIAPHETAASCDGIDEDRPNLGNLLESHQQAGNAHQLPEGAGRVSSSVPHKCKERDRPCEGILHRPGVYCAWELVLLISAWSRSQNLQGHDDGCKQK
mmetsp:Transcript_39896/g.86380  ORF Transcript_39896/g.86380 Transcript_39896/m.86380 type:complete len:301 (-) Transcript_39896:268-1170(-)